VIESIFVHQDAIARHLHAGMLLEREAYLGEFLASGYNRALIADRAAILLHVIRLLTPVEGRITDQDIAEATDKWANEPRGDKVRAVGPGIRNFITASRSWSHFLGVYPSPAPSSSDHFEPALAQFDKAMRNELGYLPSSAASCSSSVKQFLTWASTRAADLNFIRLSDVDGFLAEQRKKGRSHATMTGYCRSLRTFFRYAEQSGWSNAALSKTIKGPRKRASAKGAEMSTVEASASNASFSRYVMRFWMSSQGSSVACLDLRPAGLRNYPIIVGGHRLAQRGHNRSPLEARPNPTVSTLFRGRRSDYPVSQGRSP
jgi:hypothetical protein